MARYDNIDELEPDHQGAGLRVGIVMSRFNGEVGIDGWEKSLKPHEGTTGPGGTLAH